RSFYFFFFFFSSRRRHTRSDRDWSSDVCSSDLNTLPSRSTIGLDRAAPNILGQSDAIGPNGQTEGKYADYAREAEELLRTMIDAAQEIAQDNPLVNPSITLRLDRNKLSEPDGLLSMAHETSLRYSIMNYLIQNPGESYTVSSDG